jgi:CopG family nickel-responsive transcriptional regulator
VDVTVLKGRGSEVQSFANQVIAERGVRHGHAVYVSAPEGMAHSHAHPHAHDHSHPNRHARKRQG